MVERSGSDAVTSGMKRGGYYDLHSEYQRRVVEGGDPVIRSRVAEIELRGIQPAFVIADYGAGTGATSVHAVGTAIAALRERSRELPVWAIHNDVLTNDFTQLFRGIADSNGYLGVAGGPIFPAAAGGSFYRRVVPSATVHLGMCSNAAHWYREQPRVEISEGMYFADAHGEARERLAAQAAVDWLGFLRARADELAPGGRLIVQGIATTKGEDGRELVSAGRLLRVMYEVASELASEGKLDPDVLTGYVFPAYCRSVDEASAPMGDGAPLAGELEVLGAAVEEVSNPYWERLQRDGDRHAYAHAYTAFVLAFSEATLLEHLFTPGARGVKPDELSREFFGRFERATEADPDRGRFEAWILRFCVGRT